MNVTPSRMLTSVSPDCLKAKLPMDVTPSGMVTDLSAEQLWNAEGLTTVSPAGMVTCPFAFGT